MLKKLLTAGAAVSLLAIGLGPVNAAEEAGNNLSVPAIFVPSVGVGTPSCTADDDTVLPTAGAEDPVDGAFPGYWIQGEDVWQADCATAADNTVTAGAEWGDNLTSAPLKAGTPIRTEIGLLADATAYPMTGFGVDKLTPDLEDRYATYGTNDGSGITPYTEVRVWNAGADAEHRQRGWSCGLRRPLHRRDQLHRPGRLRVQLAEAPHRRLHHHLPRAHGPAGLNGRGNAGRQRR